MISVEDRVVRRHPVVTPSEKTEKKIKRLSRLPSHLRSTSQCTCNRPLTDSQIRHARGEWLLAIKGTSDNVRLMLCLIARQSAS